MRNWSEMDLSRVELATMSAEEWEAFKAEVRRRAHAERRREIEGLFARLRRWMWAPTPRPRLPGDDLASSYKRPLYFGGRA